MVTAAQLLASIPSLPRAELSRLADRLIDRMDEIDGDPDLEPETDIDDANDDGCGPVQKHGQTFWGAAEEDEGRNHVPIYGVDQSAGPAKDGHGAFRWYAQEKAHE